MKLIRNTKNALLAVTSLTAAALVAPAVQAYEAPEPIIEAAPIVTEKTVAAAEPEQSPLAKRLAVIAVGGALLAGLIRVFGAKRIVRAVGQAASATAQATVKATATAARTVGRTFRSPLRFMAVMAGLTIFALTGVGFYDVEWIGGLITGAAFVGVAAHGWMRARLALRPVRAKSSNT